MTTQPINSQGVRVKHSIFMPIFFLIFFILCLMFIFLILICQNQTKIFPLKKAFKCSFHLYLASPRAWKIQRDDWMVHVLGHGRGHQSSHISCPFWCSNLRYITSTIMIIRRVAFKNCIFNKSLNKTLMLYSLCYMD